MAEVEKEHVPVLLTQEDGPPAYLVDVGTFEELKRRIWLLEDAARRGPIIPGRKPPQ